MGCIEYECFKSSVMVTNTRISKLAKIQDTKETTILKFYWKGFANGICLISEEPMLPVRSSNLRQSLMDQHFIIFKT